MARGNFQPTERLLFGAEGGQLFHRFPLEVGKFLTRVYIILAGSIVISGGTTSGAPIGENPGNLVQTVQVDAVSKGGGFRGGKLKNLTARSILRRRVLDRGWYVNDDSLGASGLTGAAGTFTLSQMFPLNFSDPMLQEPYWFDTSFSCDAYSAAVMTITTGSKAICNPTTDRVWNETGLYFDIYEEAQFPGAYKVVELYEDDRPFVIAAANTRTPLDGYLPQGEAYLDVLMITQSTASNNLVDTILNRATWFAGTEQIMDMYANGIKNVQKRYVFDQGQSMTGLYYTPIDRDGLLGSAVGGLRAILDVSNPGGAGLDNIIIGTRRVAPGSAGAGK